MKIFNTENQRNRGTERLPLNLCCSVALCLFLSLAGFVPAQKPDVLKASPGPGFVVTDRMYENSSFTARYPSGWRVQSGEATQPLSVLFRQFHC